MAIELERLIAILEAKMTQYDKAMKKALGDTENTFTRIERRGKQMESRLSAVGKGFSVAWVKALAVVGAARGFQQLLDASTRVENALKVAGLEGERLTQVYDRLFESAQKNAAPLESLVELYGRASQVQSELGVTTEELIGFTDKVAVALRVSGKSAAESSGALLQLSQALGSGVVRAEEFNSILEGALPIAQAAAAGLEEAGGSVAKLRQLVIDGKVSSEAFFRAFEAGSVILDQKVAGAELTVSQGFVRLTNVLIRAVGQFDEATGTSDALAKALGDLAGAVQMAGQFFEDNEPAVRGFAKVLADTLGYAVALVDVLPKALAAGEDRALYENLPGYAEFIANAEKGVQPTSGTTEAPIPAGPPKRKAPVSTVSLDDFAVSNDAAAKAAERHAKQVAQLISDLTFERDILGETALEQDILNTMHRAGVDAASAEGIAIRQLVTEIEAQKDAIEATQEAIEAFGSAAKDAVRTFIDDMIKGKSVAESFAGILGQLGSSLLDAGLSSLFSGGGSGLFGGFRASGGPVQAGRAYVVGERRPELFVPSTAGRIEPRTSSGGASSGGQVNNFYIDASGAEIGVEAKIVQAIRTMVPPMIKSQAPAAVGQASRDRTYG